MVMALTLKILSKFGGTIAGESVGAILVNSSAKFDVSNSFLILGINGGLIFFSKRSVQFKP